MSCFSQILTTIVPEGMGMTNNYEFYYFVLNNEGRISIAMASTDQTIHICPYIVENTNNALFKAVMNYEFGHYCNYISHGEAIISDTSEQNVQTNDIIDTVYWKTSPNLNKIVYKGYDGSSFEKAIIIKATTMKEGIAAEYAYLEKELGQRGVTWKPLGQYLLPDSGKYYDVVKVNIINTSEIRYFWIDITKFFGKF